MTSAADNVTEYVLRGLRHDGWLKQGGVTADAFKPDDRTVEARRTAGKEPGSEISITWHDNAEALVIALSDKVNAKHGAVRLNLDVEHVRRVPDLMHAFFWERDPVDGNPYHGNIVVRPDVSPGIKRKVSVYLAMMSGAVT